MKLGNAMRTINCMGLDRFQICFGEEMGLHLWMKFTEVHGRNIASWLMYLDSSNERKLMNYIESQDKLYAVLNLQGDELVEPNQQKGVPTWTNGRDKKRRKRRKR